MSIPEDLHRHLKREEQWIEAQEVAIRKIDSGDFDMEDLRDCLFNLMAYRRDKLKQAIVDRDFIEVGKQIENCLYEYLTEKEADHD